MTKRTLPAALLVLLLLWGCGEDPPALPRLPADGVILAFGDSLTYGSGANQEQSYPAVLEQMSGRRVINAGLPGEASAEGRERLSVLLDEYEPDLLILMHGGNDMLRRLDPAATADNLRAMIEMARERDVPVVLLGVPRPGLWVKSADFYRRVADELGVPLENEIVAAVEGERALKSDPIHPNAQGYRLIAEAVHRLLQDGGAL